MDPSRSTSVILSRGPTQRQDEAEELSAVSLEVFLDLHSPGFLLLVTATQGTTLLVQHRRPIAACALPMGAVMLVL